jgi:hypothetical protein
VVREGVGQGGEMTQALYAHINNKIKKKKDGLVIAIEAGMGSFFLNKFFTSGVIKISIWKS